MFFFSGPVDNFALQPFQIFVSSFHQNYGMSVAAYDSIICKNPGMFFDNFEWINLIFILVQLDGLYSIHIIACSLALDYFSYL